MVNVHLLDPSTGRPIKTWSFSNPARITIGRAAECHVEVSDPYVSRNHAELVFRQGQWCLISLGRHGVVVANQLISELPILNDVRFRLGQAGPTLQFSTSADPSRGLATISFDSLPQPLVQLDQQKLDSEVNELSESNYFRTLQERAKDLRRQRGG